MADLAGIVAGPELIKRAIEITASAWDNDHGAMRRLSMLEDLLQHPELGPEMQAAVARQVKTSGGFASPGSDNPQSKLDEETVRRMRADDQKHTAWAARLGVSESTVRNARNGVTWSHVK